MSKFRTIPIGTRFGISDAATGRILDQDGEFSLLKEYALLFDSTSAAWQYVIRKKLTFKTDVINLGDKNYNFSDDLRPLFEAMIAGKIIKSVTYYTGLEVDKITTRDFFADYYLIAVPSNNEAGKEFDLVSAYAGGQSEKYHQFYMNWIVSFELY